MHPRTSSSPKKRDTPDGLSCAFNRTREAFLSFKLGVADTHLSRLRGLLGMRSFKHYDGLWVVPSQGVHSIGVVFPVDLIYLDEHDCVVHLEEHFKPFRLGPYKAACYSVLQLRVRTIYNSDTQLGDKLLICRPQEMARVWQELREPQARTAGVTV